MADIWTTPEKILECSGKRVAIDVETTGLHWWEKHIIGIGVHCSDANVSGYYPTIHEESERDWVYETVKKLEPGTTVIMHNAKFEHHFLHVNPQKTGWMVLDTTILAHLYDSRLKKALGKLEEKFLGTSSKRDHVTSAPPRTKIWNWPLETVADYCVNDSVVTYQLAELLVPKLVDLGLWELYKKEIKYFGVIWSAEHHGLLIDDNYFLESMEAQRETLDGLEERMYDSIGYEFNWRSTKQLSKALYQDLGIPKPKNPFAGADGIDRSRFADSGLYKSTCTATFLLTEKVHHPLGELVGALRESARMLKTMESYMELADEARVVHPGFNQARTRTGRLSCGKPNAQNVPSKVRGRFTQSVYSGEMLRTDEYNLRKGFIARPGFKLLSVDWKQMEMRKFGILSQDPFMLKTLSAGRDVHAEVAERVWGVRDKVHREWSKTIGFGLIYGMTLGSLMHKLNMTHAQAGKIKDDYVAAFPRILPWMDEVIAQCMAFNYVRYWSGRMWREENKIDMYKAANAVIQGGCADILSVAALRTDKWCKEQGSQHNIVSFIHDEIMFEVPEEDEERSAKELMEIMEVPDLFEIPFFTDAKSGPTYGDQVKLFQEELGYEPLKL